MDPVRTFRDLVVWRKAFELCLVVYRITDRLPLHERYGLRSELRKTARSIVYNIAEGNRRSSTREYIRFLDIACGSAAELETQILLSETLGYLDGETVKHLLAQLASVERMLSALMKSLRARLRSLMINRRRPGS